jgi:hypothetical protein
MPVHRRRSIPQIAKVNARSIDGYFGEGTPCFFIRGTILSDAQVDGEYRTLAIHRPGNLIEIESFDGDWAVVVIKTRAGNRQGDNLTARVMLRDADLRMVGIDCGRILAGLGGVEQPAPVPQPEVVPWTDTTPAPSNGSHNGHVMERFEPAAPSIESAAANDVPMPPPPPPPPAPAPRPGGEKTTLLDGKFFVEIGASIVAVGLPVVFFFLRSLFGKNDKP